jgi:hypothetical protein
MSHWKSSNVMVDCDGNVGTSKNMVRFPTVQLYKISKSVSLGTWREIDDEDEDDRTDYSHILTAKGVVLPPGFAFKFLFKIHYCNLTPVWSVTTVGKICDVVGFDKRNQHTFIVNYDKEYSCFTDKNTSHVELKTHFLTDDERNNSVSLAFTFRHITIESRFFHETADIPKLTDRLAVFPCDCSLVLPCDSSIPCHSFILKASSSYFNTILEYNLDGQIITSSIFDRDQDGLLFIRISSDEYDLKTWKLALDWMHTNELPAEPINVLQNLYCLGDMFQIHGLPLYVLVIITSVLDNFNFVHVNPYLVSLMTMALHYSTSSSVNDDLKIRWKNLLTISEDLLDKHSEIFFKRNEEFLIAYVEYVHERRRILGIEPQVGSVLLGKRSWPRLLFFFIFILRNFTYIFVLLQHLTKPTCVFFHFFQSTNQNGC